MSDTAKIRDRKYCMVLYPEDPTHVEAMERLRSGGYDYAACLHDQDVYEDGDLAGQVKKPHWHVVVRFINAVFREAFAKKLGLEFNYIQECKNVDGALRYLVHFDHPDKFQYDLEQVEGPLKTRVHTLVADKDENSRVLCLLNLLDGLGVVSHREFVKLACANGLYSDARRMGNLLTAIIREHNEEIEAEMAARSSFQRDRKNFADFEVFISNKGLDNLPPL